MSDWQYTPDLSENDMLNGNYVGFVYLFQFEDGTVYVGSKQIYKRIKDVKKLKGDEVENGWRDYTSSSKTVNQYINDGEKYTKTILWAFPTMKETLLVESMLIMHHILDDNCLNKAVLNKLHAPSNSEKRRLKGILTNILEYTK